MKNKLKKLALLTDSVREYYIKMYFQRQKLLFMVKYLNYESKNNSQSKIDNCLDQIKQLDKKLGLLNDNKHDQHNRAHQTNSQQNAKSSGGVGNNKGNQETAGSS